MDYKTGVILHEKDAGISIPPASLTKIVTAHTVFMYLEREGISLDTPVPVPKEAWSVNAPPGSSLMFLGPNQTVTVGELITGLLVTSGNDAALALAFFTAGSEAAFVERMNQEVKKLGLSKLIFADASGYSSSNRITAREFALFLREFLSLWPDSIDNYFALKEMTYPLDHNRINGNSDQGIKQSNRNALLWEYPGADGLKTGFIEESGHNLAFTAERAGRRLLGVTLSAGGASYQEAFKNRFDDAVKLLDYGFDNFVTLELGFPEPEPLRVWKGREKEIRIRHRDEAWITIPQDLLKDLKGSINQYSSVSAPVSGNSPLGEIVFTARGREVLTLPLYPEKEVLKGNPIKRAVDSIRLFFRKLFKLEKGLYDP